MAHRPGEGGIAPVVGRARVGTGVEQQARQLLVPFARAEHQRGRIVGGAGVDVRPPFQQVAHDRLVAGEGCVMQRGPLLAGAIHLGAVFHQPAHRVRMALPCGIQQGLLAGAADEIDVRPVPEEQLHLRNVALPCADHQAGAQTVGLEIGIESFRQPARGSAQVAHLHRGAEAHRIGQCGLRRRRDQQGGGQRHIAQSARVSQAVVSSGRHAVKLGVLRHAGRDYRPALRRLPERAASTDPASCPSPCTAAAGRHRDVCLHALQRRCCCTPPRSR